jgi:hypothetical protein
MSRPAWLQGSISASSRLQYPDGVLSTFLRKPRQLVIVRYDPRDMSQVYLRDEDGSYWSIPLSDQRLSFGRK